MTGDRIQVLDRPVALPGKCAICGYSGSENGDGRKFIDINFDMDFYGAVIFCAGCIVGIANKLGFISPEQADKLRLEKDQAITELQKVAAENAKLRASLDSLNFLGSKSSDIPVANIPELSETIDGQGPTDSKPARSNPKRGSKNISNNDETDDILGI